MALRILTKLIDYFEWDIQEDIKNDKLIEEKFEDLDDTGKAFWFCHRNELDNFKQAISRINNFDPNIKDKNGHSLLHILSCYGYIEFLQYLLNTYSTIIDINIVDRNNNNSAHWASMSGNVQCLKLLIKHGIQILNVDGNNSFSKYGFFVVVRQIPVYSIGGRTCIHFAAESGNIQCLNVLINYVKERDNINIINLKDWHGYTPLDLAIINKKKNVDEYAKCIQLLSEYVKDDDFVGVDMNYSLDPQDLFKQFVYDYYKSQERIAENFKDTLPGMHGNCCQTCKEMYHIADKK